MGEEYGGTERGVMAAQSQGEGCSKVSQEGKPCTEVGIRFYMMEMSVLVSLILVSLRDELV